MSIKAQFNPFRFFADKRARIWNKLGGIDNIMENCESMIFYPVGVVPPFNLLVDSDPNEATPTFAIKLYDYNDNEIAATFSYSSSSSGYTTQFHYSGQTIADQEKNYVYIKVTIDGTPYYSDMIVWKDDVSKLFKVHAEASGLTVGGEAQDMRYTIDEFYLNCEPLKINPKTDLYAKSENAIDNVYFGSRAISREIEIDADDSIFIYLSSLALIKANGVVRFGYGYEEWNASEIIVEEGTSHGEGLYQLKLSFVDGSEIISTKNY